MYPRVNPDLKKEIGKYGVQDWNECFHCGNCTALCPLTEDNALFPRKAIRQVQMGIKPQLDKNIDPWLCYYCGECSETCPRDANPGEIMMSLRRYLTATYDWTGLSRKFYTSKSWELIFVSAFGFLIIAMFMIFLPPAANLWGNPGAYLNEQGGVMINSLVTGVSSGDFIRTIEYIDWTMAGIVALLLISNLFVMFNRVILSNHDVQVPFHAYFTEFWQLIWHFLTQAKFSKCDDKNYWFGHMLLMTGYTIMFTLIVVFLPEFQTEEVLPWYNWQRILGYYATFGILFFLIRIAIRRYKKSDMKTRFSHPTDWLFIVMLGMTTVSGILIHIFRLSGLPVATYWSFVIHMAVLVPMIMIEVPFSKWSHLAYRPFAIYFNRLITYKTSSQKVPQLATI